MTLFLSLTAYDSRLSRVTTLLLVTKTTATVPTITPQGPEQTTLSPLATTTPSLPLSTQQETSPSTTQVHPSRRRPARVAQRHRRQAPAHRQAQKSGRFPVSSALGHVVIPGAALLAATRTRPAQRRALLPRRHRTATVAARSRRVAQAARAMVRMEALVWLQAAWSLLLPFLQLPCCFDLMEKVLLCICGRFLLVDIRTYNWDGEIFNAFMAAYYLAMWKVYDL